MNTKNTQVMIGGILVAVVVIGFVVMLVKTSPSKAEVEASTNKVEVIDTNTILNGATEFKAKQTNGVLPIQVPDQSPKDNPFKTLE